MSNIPLTVEVPVGYIEAEDVYVAFSEYYGGDTIYGRRSLVYPDGSPVKGAGKFKLDLVMSGVEIVQEDTGATHGWLTHVPVVPEPPVVEVPPQEEAPVVEVPPQEEAPVVEVPPQEEAPVEETTPATTDIKAELKQLYNELSGILSRLDKLIVQ